MINALRLLQLLPRGRQLNSLPNSIALQRRITCFGRRTVGFFVSASLLLGSMLGLSAVAVAQEEEIVTGSRITHPGLVSSSPIVTIDAEEINFQQEIDLERILRELPSTIPGDNENVNNGTDGIATVDIRSLGPERNLVLLNGRRMTPANFRGRVDTSNIQLR